MIAAPTHPGFQRLVLVARALGDLRERVVFIGGAIAPLLQTDPPFREARITSDVDAIIATVSYTAAQHVQDELVRLGFRPAMDARHAHRWITANGIPFDLVPTGEHLGGTGGIADRLAIDAAVTTTLEPGLRIRHASAPGFLALKWAAYQDRGRDDPLYSDDLLDILALLASRPALVDEVTGAPKQLRTYLAEQSGAFLADPNAEDLLAAHLNNAQDPAVTIHAVRGVLRTLAENIP
jgi:predicted nucleotidyltransferase